MANKIVNHPLNPFRNTDFDDISREIEGKNTMKEIEEIVEEKRKDIFDILSTSRADGNTDKDEKSLQKMKDALDKKKISLENNLGEVFLDFNISSDNNDLINYCKTILNSENPSKKDDTLARECGSLLSTLQEVYTKGKRKKILFSGKKDDASGVWADLIEPDVFSEIINAGDETTLQAKIDEFVTKTFSPKDNSFGITKSKLYTEPQEQAKVAARIAIFLHCMQKALSEGRITSTTKIKSILKNLKDKQIPKIRGLYNLKKEKEAVDAEYNALVDLRKNDKTDIDWTDTTTSIDLTKSFEGKSTGKEKKIDFYNLNKDDIEITIGTIRYPSGDIVLKDAFGEKTEINTQKDFSSGDYTLCLKVAGSEVEIGKLCIDYSDSTKAQFVFIQDPDLVSNLNTMGITGNIEVNIPVMAVKNVANVRSHTGQVSLTRNIKITINGISTPIPPTPAPTLPQAKEWTATISSVEKVHSEEAAYLAEEKDREDFDKLGELSLLKISTWHPRSRMKHFISREYKRNKAIKKHMQAVNGRIDIRRESVVNASNRHELEYGDDKRKGGIDGKIINHENPDVNRLCVEYLKTNMNDAVFEKKFNEIISHDTIIGDVIRNNEMNYLGSNILLKLKQERAEQIMMDKIGKFLVDNMNAVTLKMKDSYDEAAFKTELKNISDEYFNATQSNFPIEIRKLLEVSNDKNLMLPIIQNWKAQLQANVKNLRMQLQLLDNTTGAYEIDNKDKEKALWQRFGHWMDKHRVLTIGGSALLGTGMLGLGSVIGGPLGAGIATGLLATKMGIMSAAKKASHYTKEQKGQEKRLTHGLNIEKQNLENIRKVMEGAPWYSWRKYKAKRQYKIYQEATQHRIADTEYLTKKIQSVLNSTANLDVSENENERNILEGYLINALVRLDYYKECGHNFVASQNRTKIEQDFNILYKAVQDGVFRLNENKLSDINPRKQIIEDGISVIRTDPRYSELYESLKKDYETSLSTFKKRRGSLERRYGITSGLIYGGTAILAQYLMGSGVFGHYQTVNTIGGTSTSTLHPEVKNSLLSNGVPASKVTAIENALKSTPTGGGSYNPEAFWTIVKNETGWTDVQLNDWISNSFMKDVLWKLKEGGDFEFKKALLDGHFDTLRPGDSIFTRAETFLSSPRIGILRPGEGTTVLKNLQDYLSGAKSFSDFTPDMRIKMGHFGHMAIHNDTGIGSRLTEEVLNTITTPGREEVEEGIRHYFFDGAGVPIYANTYRKRMIPQDNEKGVILENSDPGEIPEGDEFITADPDGSTSGPSSGSAPSWI